MPVCCRAIRPRMAAFACRRLCHQDVELDQDGRTRRRHARRTVARELLASLPAYAEGRTAATGRRRTADAGRTCRHEGRTRAHRPRQDIELRSSVGHSQCRDAGDVARADPYGQRCRRKGCGHDVRRAARQSGVLARGSQGSRLGQCGIDHNRQRREDRSRRNRQARRCETGRRGRSTGDGRQVRQRKGRRQAGGRQGC